MVHHRAVCARHALQTGQRAGVKTELGVVVVLNDVPPPRGAGCPVQQLGPASGGHGDPGGELVAGGDVAHRRIAGGKSRQRQAVRDWGRGIENVEQARRPMYTTGGSERSGMGFTIMESFTDRLVVRSVPGKAPA